MKALVFRGVGKIGLEDVPKPDLQTPTDAIVKVTQTTICGTDLHILKGDVPTCKPGTILGHEGIGFVEQVGTAVQGFKAGDPVIISCISACATCKPCQKGMTGLCTTGGWTLGNHINGTQAEFVRIPHASTSLHPCPIDPKSPEAAKLVMLSDALPTGFECGILQGKVQPGDNIAIVGSGAIGLSAVLTGQLYSPAKIICIDTDANRLATAKSFGATHTIQSSGDNAKVVKAVMELTDGEGVDAAIEAVGVPATFELCSEIIGLGGRIANVGVHGKAAQLHLETLWSKDITITTRLVDARVTPMLLSLVNANKLDAGRLVTHKIPFNEGDRAYQVFTKAAENKTLKVVMEL